jgi:hypothetical protein
MLYTWERATGGHLGGVMVSGFASGPKVHRFKPGQRNRFLREIKIWSMPSFGGEVKTLTTGDMHLKNHFKV